MSPSQINQKHFQLALKVAIQEAQKFQGATAPNPPVGACALDKNGKVLAVSAHQRAGEDHAEALLLKECQEKNIIDQIKTLAITLEPCNHTGKTPPCTDAILQAGIPRIIIGAMDPNPKAHGGAQALQDNGRQVITRVLEKECLFLIRAFRKKILTGTPWITLKQAFNKQGSMIPPKGMKTFTSPTSLILAHELRKRSDAILTGSGTILADSPLFTVRHVPDHPGKKRFLIVLDRRCQIPKSYTQEAQKNGFEVVEGLTLNGAFDFLKKTDALEVLVEAGPALSQSILDQNIWDEHVLIHQGKPDRVEVTFRK
jgi:diaminohydroxyphosphoribosylaminopyrimidine deaminase / 5-amino-6-(5-phosphoribosylamino)uracil reductase